LNLSSEGSEHVLVGFVAENQEGQDEVAEGEDKHHDGEEDGPAVHHDEGEYDDPRWEMKDVTEGNFQRNFVRKIFLLALTSHLEEVIICRVIYEDKSMNRHRDHLEEVLGLCLYRFPFEMIWALQGMPDVPDDHGDRVED